MGRLSFNGPMRKYKDLDANKENGSMSVLREDVDYSVTMYEPTKPIKDVLNDEQNVKSTQLTFKNNNVVTFYLNNSNHEILIDKVDYHGKEIRLSIKLLKIDAGYTFKDISVLNRANVIFVILHKLDTEGGRGMFMKAIKLNDIINIDRDMVCYGG